MTQVEVRGVRLHVQRLTPPGGAGVEGPAVVFAHGVLGNMSAFYYAVANHVAAAGHDAILYDLRGHGLSECPTDGYRIEDMVADLEALLETVEPNRPVHLVGYSLGGTIAQRLTAARPDLVASLILVDGLVGPGSVHAKGRWEEWLTGDDDAAGRLADAVVAMTLSEGKRRAARTRRLLTETTFYADFFGLRSTESETAPLIARPTLVVSAEESEFFAGACETVRLIPDCRSVVLAGYDHDTVLTEGAPAVRRAVIDWLAEYPAERADQGGKEPTCHASFSSSLP